MHQTIPWTYLPQLSPFHSTPFLVQMNRFLKYIRKGVLWIIIILFTLMLTVSSLIEIWGQTAFWIIGIYGTLWFLLHNLAEPYLEITSDTKVYTFEEGTWKKAILRTGWYHKSELWDMCIVWDNSPPLTAEITVGEKLLILNYYFLNNGLGETESRDASKMLDIVLRNTLHSLLDKGKTLTNANIFAYLEEHIKPPEDTEMRLIILGYHWYKQVDMTHTVTEKITYQLCPA